MVGINLPRAEVTGAVGGGCHTSYSPVGPRSWGTTNIYEKRNEQSVQQGEARIPHGLWFPFGVDVGLFPPPEKKNRQSGRL